MDLRRVSFTTVKMCGSRPGKAILQQQPDAAEDAVPTGDASHGMIVLFAFQVQAHVAHISLNL